ncbi:hypothetical protein PG985_003024 [Apiospora marii]
MGQHDRLSDVFCHRSNRLQTLNKDEDLKVFVNIIRDITSWDTLYFRLRSCFDGYASSIYAAAPSVAETDGPAEYICHRKLVDIRRVYSDYQQEQMGLTTLDCSTGEVTEIKADLVIGADGPDSFVRSRYLHGTRRQYVGYIAWRGTVREADVSAETREVFHRSVTLQLMHLQHCIMYTIPGHDGSLKPGERLLNFLWYTNESEEALDEIMIDGVDGHRHHNIVPAGRVRQDIWDTRVDMARRIPLTAPFLEVITKIERPFVQVITEFCSERAAFEDGRVLLVGDALSLYRPHTAFSATQAAFDALQVREHVDGKISVQRWENRVLRFARLHWLQSIWWGSYYQHRRPFALLMAMRYWAYCAVDRLKAWWHGEEPLLRTSVRRLIPYDP